MNSILYIIAFPASLGWLKLGNNRLDHIPSNALSTLRSLKKLDLNSNNINYVQEDAFMGFSNDLRYVLLNNNR